MKPTKTRAIQDKEGIHPLFMNIQFRLEFDKYSE